MTQEEKRILFVDLCARLPHGVKLHIPSFSDTPQRLQQISDYETVRFNDYASPIDIDEIMPYLRPMLSMTEEEFMDLCAIDEKRMICSSRHLTWHLDGEVIDYFNSRMLDWRGLIPQGLALEAPEGMYKFE